PPGMLPSMRQSGASGNIGRCGALQATRVLDHPLLELNVRLASSCWSSWSSTSCRAVSANDQLHRVTDPRCVKAQEFERRGDPLVTRRPNCLSKDRHKKHILL